MEKNTQYWQKMDAEHHLHPFMDHKNLRQKGARIITHADGVYIWDSEGNKILDGMAGLWCTQVGYGNDELVEAAHKAMKTLPYYNLFFMSSHPYAAELSAKIADKLPGSLNQIHFACSGSEAVDTAYKMIRYYWNLKGQKERKHFISREYAYHGSTTVGASLSGLFGMHPQFDLPLPGIHHVKPGPYYYAHGAGMTEEEFTDHCVHAVEAKILEIGPEKVAAFVGEPVQGAGGLIIPPKGYWKKIEALCRKYGILLWMDEVICGWGRLGDWFGCSYFGVEPDMVTMAKGLSSGYQPISACALGGDLAATIAGADQEMAHGFTYAGHPVACAVALKNIEILERDGLVGAPIQPTIAHFQTALSSLQDHPLVGEVRSIGLLGAIELSADKKTRSFFASDKKAGYVCREHSLKNGLVMRAVRDTMILCPPLIISREEIDLLVQKARKTLDDTAKDLGIS